MTCQGHGIAHVILIALSYSDTSIPGIKQLASSRVHPLPSRSAAGWCNWQTMSIGCQNWWWCLFWCKTSSGVPCSARRARKESTSTWKFAGAHIAVLTLLHCSVCSKIWEVVVLSRFVLSCVFKTSKNSESPKGNFEPRTMIFYQRMANSVSLRALWTDSYTKMY